MKNKTLSALKAAERFMLGFEDDEMQPGINAKLKLLRAAIAAEEKLPRVIIQVSGGVVTAVQSSHPISYDVLDWDNYSHGATPAQKKEYEMLNAESKTLGK